MEAQLINEMKKSISLQKRTGYSFLGVGCVLPVEFMVVI